MTFLRGLRLLVLGETWTVPGGVLLVLLIGAGGREAFPRLWERFGGAALLVGVICVLTLSVARSALARV